MIRWIRKAGKYVLCLGWRIAVSVYAAVLSAAGKLPRQTDEWIAAHQCVYLTFDDGPSKHTRRLLSILRKYNVKATFFVTCKHCVDMNILSEIVRDGHAIGNHTFSHQYKSIYADEEMFFSELNSMEECILEKTAVRTRLMRFPGGSSNTVSRFNPGIMTRLAETVQTKGYHYFDWNVDSGDAGKARLPWKVYHNVTCGIKENNVPLVLQHDDRQQSIDAAELILIWGLRHGYAFVKLDEGIPPAHHIISN